MVRKICFLLSTLLLLAIAATAQTTRILFIGNSYTAVNDLPALVTDLALSLGDTVVVQSSIPGGYQLVQHVANGTTMGYVAQGDFDFVVIQEQSQKPAFPPGQVATETYPYAAQLVDSIRAANPCTEPVFYMTWGRENGDQANCGSYPPLCTFEGMNYRLRQSYIEMANDNNCTVSPVGTAWKTVRDDASGFLPTLYAGDGSHPSIHGSYLAACVFYSTLFRKSSVGASFTATLAADEAAYLQNVASNTVLDSTALWRVGANLPTSTFGGEVSNSTVNFSDSSTNAATYFWDFGDDSTSTAQSPAHTYAMAGEFVVTLIVTAEFGCASDTVSHSFAISEEVGIPGFDSRAPLTVWPNPAGSVVQITGATSGSYLTLFDALGNRVLSQKMSGAQQELNISQLPRGLYLVRVANGRSVDSHKLVIQ